MDQGRRTTDRKSVGLLVKLKHESVGSFAEEFATNLSPGGMFIRSRTPQPVGTPVKFEVQIAGGVRVLRGTADVRWVREVGDPSGPPGMGLQFQELDPASRALVDMMLLQRGAEASVAPVAPLPAVAPVVAPLAPAIAPLTPAVAPVQAKPVAAPAPRAVQGAALDSLFDDLEAPPAPALDEAFDFSPPPPAAESDVDIPLDELIASTPPPPDISAGDEPLPGLDFEMEGGEAPMAMGEILDEAPIEVGITVEVESSSAASAPSKVGVPMEFDLDLSEAALSSAPVASVGSAKAGGLEFELDLSEAVEARPAAPVSAKAGGAEFELDFSDAMEELPPARPPAKAGGAEFELDFSDAMEELPPAAPAARPSAPPPAPVAAKVSGGSTEFDLDLSDAVEELPSAPAVRPVSAPPPPPVSAVRPATPPPPPPSSPAHKQSKASLEFELDFSDAMEELPPAAPPPDPKTSRPLGGAFEFDLDVSDMKAGASPGVAAPRVPAPPPPPASAFQPPPPPTGLQSKGGAGVSPPPPPGFQSMGPAGVPPPPPMGHPSMGGAGVPPPPPGFQSGGHAGVPPPPPGFQSGGHAGVPPPPPGFQSVGAGVPPPPPGFQSGGHAGVPPPPPGFQSVGAGVPPPPGASPSLPNVRREAPRAPEPVATPTLVTPVAKSAPAAPALDERGLPKTVFLPPPPHIAGTGPVIGIDLGTTNSCVALLSNGRPIVLRSREGYNTIPSVISLNNQNKLLVSHRAKNQLVLRPQHTIYGAKRLVGRPYDSAVVNQVRERFHYDIVPDAAGRAAVRIGDSVLSLEEVQAIILRECKEMAEAHLNQKVERAVVTVPAYYSEPQREAVRKSGILAGLKIERILNEPTSAALAYGLNRELNKKVLVYDLGGGTFDATILKIEKNVFEVLGTGGDIFLGGIDFDNLIVDFLLQRFQEKEGLAFNGDGIALSRVSDAAERAKMALSERASFEVHIPMLMMDDAGRPRDLRVVMNRQELEKICDPLLSRTVDVVRDVLLDAKLKASEVDDIILVGGMSRMPLVRDKLKGLFGKGPQASVNADEAVALGAALYSGSVDKVSSVVLIDVLPMTVGVAMPGGAFKRVIERNSPLPAQRSFAISTNKDNEEVLELSLFQGEDNHISANEYLGTVRIEGLPKGPKGSVRVAVTIKLDSECVLHVEAREYSTRREVKATLATRYSPEELQKQLQVSKESVKAAEDRRGADLKERAGGFWRFVKKALGRK
ncbi:DnaK family protein [Myxococcus stipitatus DSM 14675]|uniref:DnaK family protein n=1 Tax=Myxococcus stipitatus (strain DSM 14675 / JCM 12634 / Mx s8) TaxID=1278073 RepID=L7UKQ2_MYXSD|nr:TIGR02266 family protein [Myxococcus stipitatus]AGC48460.1 DnaK family protein [Myxococcus stipitatus DSM 14675]